MLLVEQVRAGSLLSGGALLADANGLHAVPHALSAFVLSSQAQVSNRDRWMCHEAWSNGRLKP